MKITGEMQIDPVGRDNLRITATCCAALYAKAGAVDSFYTMK